MSSPITHRIEINTRIADACDTESTRYAFGYVQVTPHDENSAFLAATNSRILAVVQASAECPTGAMMPAKIVPPPTGRKVPTVCLNGRWENSKGQFEEIIEETGRFPKCGEVIPDMVGRKYLALGLNAELLRTLQRAVNRSDAETITLFLPIPTDADAARYGYQVNDAIPVVGSEGLGVIMPVTIGDSGGTETAIKQRAAGYAAMRDAFRAARETAEKAAQ